MKNEKGITLVELMITLAIFSIVIAGVYAAYVTQIKHGTREYRIAESDMELEIAKSIIERDIATAGYGLADDYNSPTSPAVTIPVAIGATNANPDTLTLMGTALGRGSRAAQAWSYMVSDTQLRQWNDARENIRSDPDGPNDDRVIYIEPATKKLQKDASNNWGFSVTNFPNAPLTGSEYISNFVYAVATTNLNQPFYSVRYYLSGASPSVCASGTESLLRAESNTDLSPGSGDPLLACVLDFQVAFGLDTNENGTIDCWDNGGATAAGYDLSTLKTRLKQVRAYALVQLGNRDPDYTFPTNPIRVGDANLTPCTGGGGVGRDVTLTADQLKYRWRVVTFNITPRNLR